MNMEQMDLELTEVCRGVYRLRLPIPFEDGHVNCFLLPRRGGVLDMIDCGMGSEESFALVRAAIRELGGPGGRLGRLVVTHIHPDHYGGAGEMTEGEGAELYLHRLEVPMVHPRYLEIEQLVEEVGRYLEIHGVPHEEADFLKNASRHFRKFVRPAHPRLQLDGTEVLELGERRLRVEWTPGHSPGHVCLFDLDSGILFAGDHLLPELTPNIGLHPQSTPNPLDDYLTGLRRVAELRPAMVLPAHGAAFTAVAARVADLVQHHERRKAQIEAIVGDGELDAWRVAVAVWGRRENLHDMRMALQEGLAHLQSLSFEGRLEKRATPAGITWRRR
ncbi:MAG TPA: MBL fold metallo-hydrolase [Candidatus Dormibacteraeota bacterium]|nr:MBL fold metallo-hydrolase [Candidatus Dormibacteraeota bacterium]